MLKIHPNFKNILICLTTIFFLYLAYTIFFGSEDPYPDITVDLADLLK